ncbi:tetratricopeptide repeat protein, partial [Dactylosporangium sp. NPDC048998]|uniref:tetratricopeptide repeat protein n=1 Tax=Dactylosporangium sp. NPDC048998 TaxID=3363976 RepID=UPI00371E2347
MPVGTCFWVAADVVVTAWHVLDQVGAGDEGCSVSIDVLGGGSRLGTATVRAVDPLRDLAVLTCAAGLEGQPVVGWAATESVAPATVVTVTGVAQVLGEASLRYSSATGDWQGQAMRGNEVALGVLKNSGVARGMSGAPARRVSDDHVVGVVTARYNSADGWQRDTVWIARTEDLRPLLAGLVDVPFVDAAPPGSPLDLTLTVSAGTVRLSGAGVEASSAHGGLRPGLVNALHDVHRERASLRVPQRHTGAPTLDVGNVSLRRAGELLAESFLPAPVAQALATQIRRAERETAAVRLAIDAPGFPQLPWEAMPEPVTYQPLALHPLISVYRKGPAAGEKLLPGPLRIAVAIASPDDGGGALLAYEDELRSVIAAVRGARQGDAAVTVVPFATTAAIRAALDAPGGVHVLHVSAHGAPGVLLLEDEEGRTRKLTPATFLAEAVPPGKMPPVIALAACYTDVAGDEHVASYAVQLAEHGARAVIATQTTVTDQYATQLFSRVYTELAQSALPDVVQAVADARRAVQRDLATATEPLRQLLAGMDEWSVVTLAAGHPQVRIIDGTTLEQASTPARTADAGGLVARPVGHFVGRRTQQRRLPLVLEDTQYAGVVLYGIGGIGKTTLAAEILRRSVSRTPSWRIATTAGPLTVDGVLTTVATSIRRDLLRRGITSGPLFRAVEVCGHIDVPWQDRHALLRDDALGVVPVLVVLDNFEDNLTAANDGWTVTDPDVAALLADWSTNPATSRLLITSRYPFTLPGGTHQRLLFEKLGPMSAAETQKLLWSLPNLDRYAVDTAAVDHIWRAVGGHPRSLEYLDALLGHGHARFTDVTERLDRAVRTRLGPDRARDWLAEQRTLDAALAEVATLAADDILLTDHLARLADTPGALDLLIGVSVYREPVDHNAMLFAIGTPDDTAAFVPDRQGIAAQLATILNRHSLTLEDLDRAADHDSPLPPSERIAVSRLKASLHEPPRPPRVAPHDLDHLAAVVENSSLLTIDAAGRAFVHRWTATELHHHAAATRRPDAVTRAHRSAAAFWRWRVAVWPQDRLADIHDLEEARHHLLAAGDTDAAGQLTEHICHQLHAWGAWDRETSLIHDTLRWLPSDHVRRPAHYHQFGILAQLRGDYAEAERRYQQSLTISKRLGDQAGLASGYHQLGMLAQDRGDYAEAERRYQQSLTIFEGLGDQSGLAASYGQFGILAQLRGDYAEAERRYQQSLTIFEQLGDQAGLASSYHQLGILAQLRGDYAEAERRYQQSLTIEEQLGN